MRPIIVSVLLFSSYAVSDLHTLASSKREVSFPLFHGYELPDGTWWDGTVKEDRLVYDMSEHISKLLVLLALIVALNAQIVKNFFVLECCDLIDYMLRYNYRWGTIGDFEVDFDLIKITLAFVFSLHFIWTHRHSIGSSE